MNRTVFALCLIAGFSGCLFLSRGDAVCDTCDPETEYCEERAYDGPSNYSCEPLPESCEDEVNCDCLEEICGSCNDDQEGVWRVQCVIG